ncbi:hypothetical protein Vretimale_18540 [Volvox reticuliferus]|nr:hypothetical protein Vretimale_18540 [Volvox reticuliferus]
MPPPPPHAAAPSAHPAAAPINSASSGFQLRPIHVVIFAAIFLGGALFAALTLQFTSGLDFQAAATTVARRVTRSVAFRQLCVIACAICLVRFGLNNVLRALAKFSSNPVQWDKSKVYYILKEVYQPLELLLFIAAICTIADSFVPQLIAVPRSTVMTVVRSTLSVSFIIGAAVVVFNLKSRFCKENAWQSEMNGDVTAQRRWEAYDKLGTFVIYTITFVLGIQALGLEVTSVLAIGGIGGLAIGLAGREICENILNGFLIMSTSPFEVGDEVHFFHSNKVVEGMVLDIGWYRTTIRSYEREVFVIPNAVFSKNIVLNITRKNREWRFFEMICVRVQDVHKVNAIIQDIRRIVRNDQRIITKLHRRIFLDKLTHEDCRIYVSFYVEAQNRESFMAAKQDLLLAFVDCVERNGAKLAVPRTTVQMEPEVVEALSPMLGAAAAMAAAKVTMDVQQAAGNAAAVAAARALTDGRTITAEVTAVPSTGSAGGTTATASKAATGSPGSSGKNVGGGNTVAAAALTDVTATSAAGGGGGGSGGGAAASLPTQGSSKGEGEKAASVVTVPVGGSVVSGTAATAGAAAASAAPAGGGGGASANAVSGSSSVGIAPAGTPPPAVVVPLVDTSGPGGGGSSGTVATVVTRFNTYPKQPPPPAAAAASAATATATTAAPVAAGTLQAASATPAAATAAAVRRDTVSAASFAMTLDVDGNDGVEYDGGGSSSGGGGDDVVVVLASFDDIEVAISPSMSEAAMAAAASWESSPGAVASAVRAAQPAVAVVTSGGGGGGGGGGSPKT